MDIFGIGPLEILFIILIALIVLGPKDIAKTGRSLGRFMRQVATSPSWKAVQQTSKELRNLPTKLMREAGLEEDMKEIQSILPDQKDLIPTDFLEYDKGQVLEDNITSPGEDAEEDISDWLTTPTSTATEAKNPQKSTTDTSD